MASRQFRPFAQFFPQASGSAHSLGSPNWRFRAETFPVFGERNSFGQPAFAHARLWPQACTFWCWIRHGVACNHTQGLIYPRLSVFNLLGDLFRDVCDSHQFSWIDLARPNVVAVHMRDLAARDRKARFLKDNTLEGKIEGVLWLGRGAALDFSQHKPITIPTDYIRDTCDRPIFVAPFPDNISGPNEVSDAPKLNAIDHLLPEARIEITLENGRKLSISNGVDAGFVLELARGLAA